MFQPDEDKEFWFRSENLQRLVDGSLPAGQLRQFMQACEANPELWRACSLAFIEEACLRDEFQLMAGCTATRKPASVLSIQAAMQSIDEKSAALKWRAIEAPATKTKSFAMLRFLALAASLVLAFLGGWQSSKRWSTDISMLRDSGSVAVGGQAPVLADANSDDSPALPLQDRLVDPNSTDESKYVSQTSDAAEVWSALLSDKQALTEYAIEQAMQQPDQFMYFDKSLPPKLMDWVNRGLVQVESTEGVVPVSLDNGVTAVIPVQQIELRPTHVAY